jgi:ADP-ribosyl-[dinitrogen reductase] hydrolase
MSIKIFKKIFTIYPLLIIVLIFSISIAVFYSNLFDNKILKKNFVEKKDILNTINIKDNNDNNNKKMEINSNQSDTYFKSDEFLDKIKGSIFGQFIGDSLAMPVHWYYDTYKLKSDFGAIKKYEAPKDTFPGSILNLSNTDGPGRGSDKGNLIGEVILHGKKKFWARGKSYHYHHGMKAGENTLDNLITRVLYRNLIANKSFNSKSFVEDYVKFMTTPDTHNDVYASTSIRIFFKNYSLGKSLDKCPGNDGHNTDAIDSLIVITPVILSNLFSDEKKRNKEIEESIMCTRLAEDTVKYAFLFSDMMLSVLKKEDSLRNIIQKTGLKLGYDIEKEAERIKNKPDPMTACYIDSSFPVLLIYAYKYADDPEKMLLASANGGGENVGRGSLLGALAGAEFGFSKFPQNLVDDLVDKNAILNEIKDFTDTFI